MKQRLMLSATATSSIFPTIEGRAVCPHSERQGVLFRTASQSRVNIFLFLMISIPLLTSGGCGPVANEYKYSDYPVARTEPPEVVWNSHLAYEKGYIPFGKLVVKGSKETALSEAAKRGASIVQLRETEIYSGTSSLSYSHSTHIYKGQSTRYYDVESGVKSEGGFYVLMFKEAPARADQEGLDACWEPSEDFSNICWLSDVEGYLKRGATITEPLVQRFISYICYGYKADRLADETLLSLYSDIETLRLLIKEGASVNSKSYRNDVSPLAMVNRAIDGVGEKHGVVVPSKVTWENQPKTSEWGKTKASPGGVLAFWLEMKRILVSAGATAPDDAARQQRVKVQRLSTAVANGDIASAKTALSLGADPNSTAGDGIPALLLATEKGDIAMMRILLEAGANPNGLGYSNSDERSALLLATEKGDLAMMRILIKAGANVELPDRNSGTPLKAATQEANLEAMRILLEAGANPNGRGGKKYGLTPMSWVRIKRAMYKNNPTRHPQRDWEAVIKVLEEAGAQ